MWCPFYIYPINNINNNNKLIERLFSVHSVNLPPSHITTHLFRIYLISEHNKHWQTLVYNLKENNNCRHLDVCFNQGFGAGAGTREPAIKIDGSETLRHPVDILLLKLIKHIFFEHSRNITKKFIHESIIYLSFGSREPSAPKP